MPKPKNKWKKKIHRAVLAKQPIGEIVLSAQLLSCVWLFCNLMDCSSPDSSVHGIFQARILEWVAISFCKGFSQPREGTCISCVSCIDRWILYHWATWEALEEVVWDIKNFIN